jgi:hypothetical protein
VIGYYYLPCLFCRGVEAKGNRSIRFSYFEVMEENGMFKVSTKQSTKGLLALLMFHFVLFFSCSETLSSSEPNQLTAQEESSGWQLLFDGSTFAGWTVVEEVDFPREAWSVEDGCLKATSSKRSGADLITEETFDDFELKFEWRLSPGGNSGVKYRVQEGLRDPGRVRRTNWAIGFSIGFLGIALVLGVLLKGRRVPNRYRSAGLFCAVLAVGLTLLGAYRVFSLSGPSGNAVGLEFQLFDGQQPGVLSMQYSSGALYDLISPTSDPTRPAGEFNEGRILVRGNQLEHWINGVRILECDLDSELLKDRVSESKFRNISEFGKQTPGHISLQHHQDEVWFRNIKIRRF